MLLLLRKFTRLKDMNLRNKTILLTGIPGLLTVGATVFSIFMMERIGAEWKDLESKESVALYENARAGSRILSYSKLLFGAELSMDRHAFDQKIAKSLQEFDAATNQVIDLVPDLKSDVENYRVLFKSALADPSCQVDTVKAVQCDTALDKTRDEQLRVSSRLIDMKGKIVTRLSADTDRVLATVGIAIAFALIAGIIGSIRISLFFIAKPIERLGVAMVSLSEGNLDTHIPDTGREDEIGWIAHLLSEFKDKLRIRHETEKEEEAARQDAVRRALEMEKHIDAFDRSITCLLNEVTQAINHMGDSASLLTAAAEHSNQQIHSVTQSTSAARHAQGNVAAEASSLIVSIDDIGLNVNEAVRLSRDAASSAQNVGTFLEGLTESSEKIDAILHLIQDIAGQTNLLALNATIEAARAGDAGKGFSVVANEVKMLANQTGQATHEIEEQIRSVRRVHSNRGPGGARHRRPD